MHDCASILVSNAKRTCCSYAFCIVNPYINIEWFLYSFHIFKMVYA